MKKPTLEEISRATEKAFENYKNPIKEDGTSVWEMSDGRIFVVDRQSTINILKSLREQALDFKPRKNS